MIIFGHFWSFSCHFQSFSLHFSSFFFTFFTIFFSGCDENKPFLSEVLQDVVTFLSLPENAHEFLTLYIDNKNVRDDGVPLLIQTLKDAFGDAVFAPEEKKAQWPDRWPTVLELVEGGKKVLVEIRSGDLEDNEELVRK